MPVLVTAEIAGQTQQGYEGMLAGLGTVLKQAPGFVMHSAHPVDGGWRVLEIWESKEEANRFFAEFVAPNLPAGIRPRRSVQELHSLLRA